MKLTVVLGTNGEESFDIALNDNAFVRKWTKELRWCLDNCAINQMEAFAGLMSLDDSQEILTEACHTINRYLKGFIEVRERPLDQGQEYFNYLHRKFEQLSGSFGQPTRLFAIANDELKEAIRRLNFFIHRLEKKRDSEYTLYFSFDKNQYRRWPLDQDDYQWFEFEFPAGTLVVYYVELGKDFHDLYQDGLPIDYENLRNLHYYSGEAKLMLIDVDCFQDPNYLQWLTSKGIDPYDKSYGHGRIPLGRVDNHQEVYAKIHKYRYLKEIRIEDENGKTV